MSLSLIITSVEEETLLCPSCGDQYLHHCEVVVYERDEDATETLKTTVAASVARTELVASDGCGNPSRRRDGLTIRFECENCGAKPLLKVAQHKGLTLVGWEAIP